MSAYAAPLELRKDLSGGGGIRTLEGAQTPYGIGTGQTRKDLSQDDVRDILWTITSIEVHDRLVIQRQWSADEYAEWLTDTIARLLLQA